MMPFLYRRGRLDYLHQVVKGLSRLTVERVVLHVDTDATGLAELAALRRLCRLHLPETEIHAVSGLADPKMLVWAHRDRLREEIQSDAGGFTHYLYLEDDIEFTVSNLAYFLRARELLKDTPFLPGFFRYEVDVGSGVGFSSDFCGVAETWEIVVSTTDRCFFVNHHFPYCAMFLLDRVLAREFVNTASFSDMIGAARAGGGMLERANHGMCFEPVPPGRTSRYVLPIDRDSLVPLPECRVHHLPNNQIFDPTILHGKLRVDGLFR